MEADKFRKLNIFSQVELLLSDGNPVLSRIFLFYNIHLYTCHGFFAEIWYRQAVNKIDRVIVLDQIDVLDLYEDKITLGEFPDF